MPGPVIIAFWGLETDYGAFTGGFSSLRSLATLAYDCRRPDHFRAELIDALRLLESGDLVPKEMTGAWAGELGQVQFTPSNYLKYAVDYDGDGRRDLVGSVPDALASTANYLKAIGWRADEPWLEEVRVGESVPWQEAARGKSEAALVLGSCGRHARGRLARFPPTTCPPRCSCRWGGSARHSSAIENFGIFWEWNQSSNYSLAAAYFATRLGGAPRLNRGDAPAILASGRDARGAGAVERARLRCRRT